MNAPCRNLIVSLNWLGDCCMALPALHAWRAANPDGRLAVLAKPHLHAFWDMVPTVDAIFPLPRGGRGLWRARGALRAESFNAATVLPNSWRAALAPWLAGIPKRIGVARGARDCLLTTVVANDVQRDPARHQMWEYAALLGVEASAFDALGARPARLLAVSRESCHRIAAELPEGNLWIAMLPGAARGPAKQWPAAGFSAAGQRLAREAGARIAVLGTAAETALCRAVAADIGPAAVSLAGRTALPELAAALGRAACAICNDSGGMHLAAVMGTPVVAIYGLTNPAKTGPLGQGHRILTAPAGMRSRDVARDSAQARDALAAVSADAVANAALAVLGSRAELAYA